MLMANGTSNLWPLDGSFFDDGDDGLCMDLDSLNRILDEDPDESQNGLEDLPSSNVVNNKSALRVGGSEHSLFDCGLLDLETSDTVSVGFPESITLSPCYHSGSSSSKPVSSVGSFEPAWNNVPPTVSPMECYSDHFTGWGAPIPANDSCIKHYGSSQNVSFSSQHSERQEAQGQIPDGIATYMSINVTGNQQLVENSGDPVGEYSNSEEDSHKTSGALDVEEASLLDFGEISDILCNTTEDYSMQYLMSMAEPLALGPARPYTFQNSVLHPSLNKNEMINNVKTESLGHLTHNASLNSKMIFKAQRDKAGEVAMKALGDGSSSIDGCYRSTDRPGCALTIDMAHSLPAMTNLSNKNQVACMKYEKTDVPAHSSPHTLWNMSNNKQGVHIKDENDVTGVAILGTAHKSFEILDDADTKLSSNVASSLYARKHSAKLISRKLASVSRKGYVAVKDEREDIASSTKRTHKFIDIVDNACNSDGPLANDQSSDIHASRSSFPQPDTSVKRELIFPKEERETKFVEILDAFPSNASRQPIHSNAMGHVTYVDDDPDICILEDLSEPVRRIQSPVDGKSLVTTQRSSLGGPIYQNGVGVSKLKTNDERLIYRVALQDLSQPKSEAFPPDGTLAVPLLRHQRIALSWMVNKETKNVNCSGGILADDQGLGKTISTVALILKERSPSSNVPPIEMQQNETETLNLDDDDDVAADLTKSNETVTANGKLMENKNSSVQSKSRPAAGTLVVCPTSVLRQWSDELHNKVSSKANLSVLVYHGGNRTKDPSELAKYDVVLTTYSIVSMEVPKQPLVDEDEDETRRRGDFPPVGLSSSKKRKYPPSSSKKKGKKGMDSELFETLARPLAKVRWFRVILDEAQSIKNHRTQVARACWGLRAKRRWCLSGTPIQNAIDDLYSYFRFLKYEPYAVYKAFCSGIKVPIQRNPTTGYKKLQAVLKTIMLRRTKGTLLDGEPIINLPPKTIQLKKVEFTNEERDFYCRLEADSRAQFAEYAAAGTVKQNYVNILLMLLRLRQACDHPLLVSGCSSSSGWRSSLEVAKKLPREKQRCLLACLEASLAICGICSDPPEDAVVTTCEHVFCKQCILEQLSGDDTQCPFPKCKAHLSMSSVLSKETLKLSLGAHPGQESASDSSGSPSAEVLEPCSSSGSINFSTIDAAEALDSSKIKAAVEVLESISRPRDIELLTGSLPSTEGSASCPDSSHDLSEYFHKDSNNKGSSAKREKAIVFSQWTRMLDLLEACLKKSSISYRRLDGTMSVAARDKAVKDFNSLPEVTVMIMSLKAASLGLNMVAACHVMLLDLWWNPTTEDQAIDRAHRIGQTRPVTVLRLTVKDTVEDRILALQEKKREMVSSAFGEDETGSRQTRLTVDDLKYLFQV